MNSKLVPVISQEEIDKFLEIALNSEKRRFPKVLHSPGDEFNEVFNFIASDSYMQPHLHPGSEKIEIIYLVQGKVAIIFFGDNGEIQSSVTLEKGVVESIKVPAFTYHTYIMLSDVVVTYETMFGVYNPKTWKSLAPWAPSEGGIEAKNYLEQLKSAYFQSHES